MRRDACANIKDIRESLEFTLNEESGEEEGDLCKALDEIKRHAEMKGEKRGEKKGAEEKLLVEGRQEDLLCSTSDSRFQQQLFRKYHI